MGGAIAAKSSPARMALQVPTHQPTRSAEQCGEMFIRKRLDIHKRINSLDKKQLGLVHISDATDESLIHHGFTHCRAASFSYSANRIIAIEWIRKQIRSQPGQLRMPSQTGGGKEVQRLGSKTDACRMLDIQLQKGVTDWLAPGLLRRVNVPRAGHSQMRMDGMAIVEVYQQMFAACLDRLNHTVDDSMRIEARH
jgi:hypothetical protein